MSIAALLQAAEFLDRREREAEHGYASTLPPDDLSIIQRPKIKKTHGNRSTHNELEKNRRAHLRHCLEKLKEMVPLGQESSRHTTLGLLTKAKRFIKTMESADRRHVIVKEQLSREQRYLRRRLELLCAAKRRSVSECSSASTVSSRSHSSSVVSARSSVSAHSSLYSPSSSVSESDEVDVTGFTSEQSDSDERSVSSDSGVALSTRRLTLEEINHVVY